MRKYLLTLSVLLLALSVGAFGIVNQISAKGSQDSPAKTLHGTVSSVDSDGGLIKIKDDQGVEKALQISSATKISKAGKEIKLNEVKVGDQVHCSIDGNDDSPSAKAIEVVE